MDSGLDRPRNVRGRYGCIGAASDVDEIYAAESRAAMRWPSGRKYAIKVLCQLNCRADSAGNMRERSELKLLTGNIQGNYSLLNG